ncbi:hypothetical protein DH2020_039057 [Rehmannia glutinosa]|uniref:Uncharacterized protein n=1 Tax=Rehmannia glutinosa TaxID=99300 RepID=A0ABR0UY15_REHGL
MKRSAPRLRDISGRMENANGGNRSRISRSTRPSRNVHESGLMAVLPVDNGDPSPSPAETCLVGFVIANVVGLRYYEGTISGREMVGLVRDDLNPHDGNAIKVLNMRSVQVGYIERSAAAVLSPLIDGHLVTVEGIVPKPPGKGSRFKIPCQIHILQGQRNLPEGNGGEGEKSILVEKSVDEIFKLLDLKVSNKGVSEALEPPKDMIKSELFSHQKEGLGWLVSRENSCELPPFWEEKNGVYVNELTNYQTDTRPEPLRGGIFADDMGLGKTLTLLSLIAFDKWAHAVHSSGNIDDADNEEEESIAFRGKKRKAEDLNANKTGKRPAFDKLSSLEPKTTLIVCPPSVFSAWITQLEEHTRKGILKVYMYYGERTKDAKELQKHDIVLTTYSTLASEESWDKSPIKKIEWRRVILDEAHVIKNVNTQQSRAVTNLNAKRRWAVTGTPVQNNSFDLFSLVAFLKFEPLSMKSLWNSLIQRPLAQGEEKGISRLQVLMSAISLRRTKDKGLVGLPSKSIETYYVNLREEERKVYDQMEEEARNIVKVYISDETVVRNYSTVLSILVRLRQICTDLALCPADLRALLPASQIEEPLKEAGFKVIRLDGSMNAKRRAQVIKDFGVPAPEGPTILLASLKASNCGINLTAASTVYLLEPWWNPAVEEQAMDRVHRIGQKEDVKIVRLIARDTIEERILQLQENKRVLARKAFGRRGQKDQREISRDDLTALMNL